MGNRRIVGGDYVELVLVYLDKVTDFEGALPKDTQDELAKGEAGSFPNFPHLATTGLKKGDPISYDNRHVNLLAAQLEYAVKQGADLIRDVLSPPKATQRTRRDADVTNIIGPTLLGAARSASKQCARTN